MGERRRAGGRLPRLNSPAEVLGHASIAITKDVYGHLVEGGKRAAAEAMSAALFDVGEP